MPRLISVFSIPDLGLLEEPLVYAAGFPVRLRLVLFGLTGFFAALQLTGLSLEARAGIAVAGAVLGALPVKPPISKLLARREQRREVVYRAPIGSLVVYTVVRGVGELIVEVDGEEFDRLRVEGGLVRVELAGLEPGEHAVRLILGGQVLRELQVYSGEKSAPQARPEGEAKAAGPERQEEAQRAEPRLAG